MRLYAMESKKFLFEAVKTFRTTGAVASSSRHLIRKMLAPIAFDKAKLIAELGTGDGCVTAALLERMSPDARLVAFEINEAFWKKTRQIEDARLDLRLESAENLPLLFAEGTVDAVVSSLPLAIFPPALKRRILEGAHQALRPGGVYVQFQYSPNDLKLIKSIFAHVHTKLEVRNLPPAFVYAARK